LGLQNSSDQHRGEEKLVSIRARTGTEGFKQKEKVHSNKKKYVRFEVFTAVNMKNGVFWDVRLCGSCNAATFLVHRFFSL
jgi:hypothetical protein